MQRPSVGQRGPGANEVPAPGQCFNVGGCGETRSASVDLERRSFTLAKGSTVETRRASISALLRARNLPQPLVEAWEWQTEARCRDYPIETFFPEDVNRLLQRHHEQQAKAICAQCPVLVQCRAYALNAPEAHGIWGALTARERVTILERLHRS